VYDIFLDGLYDSVYDISVYDIFLDGLYDSVYDIFLDGLYNGFHSNFYVDFDDILCR
jgi:hypothetical protein